MSLSEIIQKAQYNTIAKQLKDGVLPESCALSKFLQREGEILDISSPVNNLSIKSGSQHIATYHKEIEAWVLNSDISPDVIPTIAGIDTISSRQYEAMREYSEFKRMVSPNYDRLINGMGSVTDWDTTADYSDTVQQRYDSIDPSIKTLLKSMDKEPSVEQVKYHAKYNGTNVGYVGPGHVVVSSDDVMRCVFGKTKRIKEFEEEYQKENKPIDASKKFAIGRYEISGSELEKIKSDFEKGALPDGFDLYRFVYYDDHGYLNNIPHDPMKDCDTIHYKGIPFAEFNGNAWELVAQSKIDGIPPITSDEMWRIFCHVTETAPHLMEQKREFQSIDDLLNSISSDVVNTTNEEHDRDDEVL